MITYFLTILGFIFGGIIGVVHGRREARVESPTGEMAFDWSQVHTVVLRRPLMGDKLLQLQAEADRNPPAETLPHKLSPDHMTMPPWFQKQKPRVSGAFAYGEQNRENLHKDWPVDTVTPQALERTYRRFTNDLETRTIAHLLPTNNSIPHRAYTHQTNDTFVDTG